MSFEKLHDCIGRFNVSVVTRGRDFVHLIAEAEQFRGTDHRIVLASRKQELSLSTRDEGGE